MWLGSRITEKDLGVPEDNQLNMSQQCITEAIKTNWIPGCIHKGITNRDRDIIKPLYSAFVRQYLEHCVLFWSPQFKKGKGRMEVIQRTTIKMIKGPKNLLHEERLKALSLFSLEKRRLRRNLISIFQYFRAGYKEDGGSLFTRSQQRIQWAMGTSGKGVGLILM